MPNVRVVGVLIVFAMGLTYCGSSSLRPDVGCQIVRGRMGTPLKRPVVLVRANGEWAWVLPIDRNEWRIGLDGTPIPERIAVREWSPRPCFSAPGSASESHGRAETP